MTSSSCPHTGPPWLSLWGSGLGEVSGPIGGAGGFDWGWLACWPRVEGAPYALLPLEDTQNQQRASAPGLGVRGGLCIPGWAKATPIASSTAA